MFDIPAAITSVSTVIDRLFATFAPTAGEKANAEAALIKAQADAALAQLQVGMSAIVEEAKSPDKWTSRARPSFLYVMYIIILGAIPLGLAHVFAPEAASNFTDGFKDWLAAIPPDMWVLFGFGYGGYTAARSYDKKMGTAS